jgi:hypothetical protein
MLRAAWLIVAATLKRRSLSGSPAGAALRCNATWPTGPAGSELAKTRLLLKQPTIGLPDAQVQSLHIHRIRAKAPILC